MPLPWGLWCTHCLFVVIYIHRFITVIYYRLRQWSVLLCSFVDLKIYESLFISFMLHRIMMILQKRKKKKHSKTDKNNFFLNRVNCNAVKWSCTRQYLSVCLCFPLICCMYISASLIPILMKLDRFIGNLVKWIVWKYIEKSGIDLYCRMVTNGYLHDIYDQYIFYSLSWMLCLKRIIKWI